jgi:FtsP/CotA-like multicopper oxidase with cupredoxin domain
MDLIVDMKPGPENVVDLITYERQRSYSIARFDISGGTKLVQPQPPLPLRANPVPRPDTPAAAPLTTITLEGGAMRWLGEATREGETRDGRSLARDGKFWALNGVVDLADTPVLDARVGEAHRIAFVNETAFPHGMHLHGHHFFLLNADGTLGDLRDTVLIAPGEVQQVVFVADNPGDWLLHCHMLGHAHAGMKTWYRVG